MGFSKWVLPRRKKQKPMVWGFLMPTLYHDSWLWIYFFWLHFYLILSPISSLRKKTILLYDCLFFSLSNDYSWIASTYYYFSSLLKPSHEKGGGGEKTCTAFNIYFISSGSCQKQNLTAFRIVCPMLYFLCITSLSIRNRKTTIPQNQLEERTNNIRYALHVSTI